MAKIHKTATFHCYFGFVEKVDESVTESVSRMAIHICEEDKDICSSS